MDSHKIALKEVQYVAIGEAIGIGLMFAVYALLGRFDTSVALGGLVGGCLAVLNFLALSVIVTLAADRAEKQDVSGGKKLVQGSYPVRMILMAVVLFVCAKSGYFDLIALVVPLLFVRPVLMLLEFFRKKGG